MEDANSETSDGSSFSDSSVCDEIGRLIEHCEQLHQHIHTSFETLNSIQTLLDARIKITYNNESCDFDDILERLHVEALDCIVSTGQTNFGENLLEVLRTCEFN